MALKFGCERLRDRVAIITGATQGIGLAIAERFAHEGANVVLSSRKQANIDAAIDGIAAGGVSRSRLAGISCHAGDSAQLKQLVDFTLDRFKGRIDILVNNAGINPIFGPAIDVDEEVFDKLFAVNVRSGFVLTKLVAPIMAKQAQGGSIIFNSSIGGFRPGPGIGIYSVTKTTLLGLTKMFAVELAPSNIRVNAIAPGVIRTKMSKALITEDGKPAHEIAFNDLNRIGEPAECAATVAFLASDDASFITGETIIVSGGGHARL